MRDIGRRIKNIEKRLNLNRKPMIVNIIEFYGEDDVDLPPDRTEGNITLHFVKYDRGQDE